MDDDLKKCEHPRTLRKVLEEHDQMKRTLYQSGQDDQGWPHTERRTHGGLSDEQVDEIKEAILASIYEDIGRSIVKKILWAGGAVLAALFAWLVAKGYIPIGQLKP